MKSPDYRVGAFYWFDFFCQEVWPIQTNLLVFDQLSKSSRLLEILLILSYTLLQHCVNPEIIFCNLGYHRSLHETTNK